MVRGVAAHRAWRRAHPAYAWPRVAQPPECAAAVDDGRGHGVRSRRALLWLMVDAVWVCAALGSGDGHRRRNRGGLPGGDRGDEALVLPGQRPNPRLTRGEDFPGALAA